MKRIGILETGHNSEELAARFGQFSDAFGRWLAAHTQEFPFVLDVFRVEDGELPAHPGACDGYIITGSAAGVYEDHASRRERFGPEVTERSLATLGDPTHADEFARWVLRFFHEEAGAAALGREQPALHPS